MSDDEELPPAGYPEDLPPEEGGPKDPSPSDETIKNACLSITRKCFVIAEGFSDFVREHEALLRPGDRTQIEHFTGEFRELYASSSRFLEIEFGDNSELNPETMESAREEILDQFRLLFVLIEQRAIYGKILGSFRRDPERSSPLSFIDLIATKEPDVEKLWREMGLLSAPDSERRTPETTILEKAEKAIRRIFPEPSVQGNALRIKRVRGKKPPKKEKREFDPGRRAFLLGIPPAVALIAATTADHALTPLASVISQDIPGIKSPETPVEIPGQLLGIPESRVYGEGELAENFLRSFETLFGGVDGNSFIFVDENGNIVEKIIPITPHVFPEDEENVLGKRIHVIPIPASEYDFTGVSEDQKKRMITACYQEGGRVKRRGGDLIRILTNKRLRLSTGDRQRIRRQERGGAVHFVPGTREELIAEMERVRLPEDTKRTILTIWDANSGEPNQEFYDKWRSYFSARYGKEKGRGLHIRKANGRELPVSYSVRGVLQTFEEKKENTFFRFAYRNAEEKVKYEGESLTKLESARRIFSKGSLPKGLQDIITGGISFIETGGFQDLTSSAQAVGPWQFLAGTAREQGLLVGSYQRMKAQTGDSVYLDEATADHYRITEGWYRPSRRRKGSVHIDERRVFSRSTEGAERYFAKIYSRLQEDPYLKKIMGVFQLKEEDFLFPAVLSSYHCGETLMLLVIKWFAENYSVEAVTRDLGPGPHGMNVYVYMNAHALARKDEVDAFVSKESPALRRSDGIRYGKKSVDYAPKVMAISRLTAKKLENPASDPEVPMVSEYRPPSHTPQERAKPADRRDFMRTFRRILSPPAAIAAGVAAGVAAEVFRDTALRKRIDVTRRKLLTLFLAAGGGVAAEKIGLFHAIGQLFERKKSKPSPEKSSESGFDFGKIPMSEDLGSELAGLDSLLDANSQYSAPHFTSGRNPEFLRWRESQTKGGREIPEFPNVESVLARAENDVLIPFREYSSPYYRLFDVGGTKLRKEGTNDKRRNHSDYIYGYPHMEELVKDISHEVNREFWNAGFPRDFRVRPILTCLVRPDSYNRLIPNSSGNSAHRNGIALDLSAYRFDIVDIRDQENFSFYPMPDDNADGVSYGKTSGVGRKHEMVKTFYHAALTKVLKKKYEAGEIFLIEESKGSSNHHFHVVDKMFDAGAGGQ